MFLCYNLTIVKFKYYGVIHMLDTETMGMEKVHVLASKSFALTIPLPTHKMEERGM